MPVFLPGEPPWTEAAGRLQSMASQRVKFVTQNTVSVLCFFVCFFVWPWPGIKPVPPALEGKVLATVLPGKSHNLDLKTSQ